METLKKCFVSPWKENWQHSMYYYKETKISEKSFKATIVGGQLVLELEIPGYKKHQVKIAHSGNEIHIKGNKNPTRSYPSSGQYESFVKKIPVDSEYDIKTTKAKLEDGVLTLTIEKNKGSFNTEIKID